MKKHSSASLFVGSWALGSAFCLLAASTVLPTLLQVLSAGGDTGLGFPCVFFTSSYDLSNTNDIVATRWEPELLVADVVIWYLVATGVRWALRRRKSTTPVHHA